jgi:release factor glutamine methyltransferase
MAMTADVDCFSGTVGEVWSDIARRLTEAGVSNGENEAKELLACALGIDRKAVGLRRGGLCPAPARAFLNSLLAQRLAHVPLAYLLGEWDFLDMTLTVTPDVLIPRPETEDLFQWMASTPFSLPVTAVADVGTGAGGLALAAARRWPGARVTAMDLSSSALAVAQWNARRHGVEARLDFRRADLLDGVNDQEVDVIAANLPYVTTAEMADLAPEVLKEPRRALDGGPDGLSLIRRLIPQAFRTLRKGGSLFLESGQGQSAAVAHEMTRVGFAAVSTARDFAGIERFIRGIR